MDSPEQASTQPDGPEVQEQTVEAWRPPLARLILAEKQRQSFSFNELAGWIRAAAAANGSGCGATRQLIRRWMLGQVPHPDYLRWLATALKIPVEVVVEAAEAQRREASGASNGSTLKAELALWHTPGVDVDGALTPDDEERIILAVRRPTRIDIRVIDSFTTILAAQRQAEDVLGSASLIRPVTAQLMTIEDLVKNARGSVRPHLVDMGAQWAEYAGWLNTSTGHPAEARAWFDRAYEWAVESADVTLAATALSFKGHLAFLLGQIGPMIGLTQAAQRDPSVWIGQRAYDAYQEARGLAS
jgi:hypothetical protein